MEAAGAQTAWPRQAMEEAPHTLLARHTIIALPAGAEIHRAPLRKDTYFALRRDR
jgi:hypothetical protein